MNKKFIAITTITIFMGIIVTSGIYLSKSKKVQEPSLTINEVAVGNITNLGRITDINASYGDGSSTIKDMKSKAKQIVTGYVVSQEQFSEVSVMSILKVNETYRGKKLDELEIYQLGILGEEDVLVPDKEYILFLGLQGTEKENKFYIIGGQQGIFVKCGETIEAADTVMKKDLVLMKKEDKNNVSPDEFINFIKK